MTYGFFYSLADPELYCLRRDTFFGTEESALLFDISSLLSEISSLSFLFYLFDFVVAVSISYYLFLLELSIDCFGVSTIFSDFLDLSESPEFFRTFY
jgi:hypothetical protein